MIINKKACDKLNNRQYFYFYRFYGGEPYHKGCESIQGIISMNHTREFMIQVECYYDNRIIFLDRR